LKVVVDVGAIPTTSTTMGVHSFDGASNNQTATSEATDLISAKKVNANDDYYEMALAA